MLHRVAVEDIEPGHHVIWTLDLPACYSSARTEEEALARAPKRITAYYAWLRAHDPSLHLMDGPHAIAVVETFRSYPCVQHTHYIVNAFFDDDRRPLAYWDAVTGLRLLSWTRRDLLDVVEALPAERLARPIAGQVHETILGILEHIAVAENWYLSQMGLALGRSALPAEPLERLDAVRANTEAQLPTLIGLERITESCGERWSPRKVLRRALWHERDHTQHIAGLVARGS